MKELDWIYFILSVFTFCVAFGCSTMYGAPNNRDLWKKVEQAEKDGLPKTAIGHLQQIYGNALGEEKYGEALRAVTMKIVMESVIEGNKPEERVNRLKDEIHRAPQEMKPLMKVILAQWYWHYFSRNRWRFMNRTQTEGLEDNDFTTWDLPKLFGEISAIYQDVLKQKEPLKKIPVTDFKDLLEKGSLPESLRPTLFDFVVHEALIFYTSGEQAAALPLDAFEIRADSDAFAPTVDFIAYSPETTDTASPKYIALHLYQELLKFHLDDPDKDAFIDADLSRLRYVRNVAVGEGKRKRYMQRLKEISVHYPESTLTSLALYYLAQEMHDSGRISTAYSIACEGRDAAPSSRGGINCSALISRIVRKEYQLKTEEVVRPRRPSKMTLKYRNIKSLSFRVIRDDIDSYLTGSNGRNLNWLSQRVVARMLHEKPVIQWTEKVAPTNDYKSNQVLVDVPALEPGLYTIFASAKKNFSQDGNKIQYCRLWVSHMALITRSRGALLEGYVVDNDSGGPMQDVAVNLYDYAYRTKSFHLTRTIRTDKLGYFSIQKPARTNASLVLVRDPNGETLCENQVRFAYDSPPKPFTRTIFFTDRSLYRPGQMVHFKGICLAVDQDKNNYRLLTKQSVSVTFRDPNRQEISSKEFVTNEFGSFSGTFVAPTDRLTGAMTLSTEAPSGRTTVRVEEYKRPKFQVTVNVPEKEFRLNDEVSLTGKAEAYTGAPIDGARATYRVFREVRLPPWWFWFRPAGKDGSAQEISHGIVDTDEKGEFIIRFKAKPDLTIPKSAQPIFTYRIQVDVTDTTGETRSATNRIQLGYTALTATLTCAHWQETDKPVSLTVNTTTLNGKKVRASGSVEIFALTGPDKPVPADLIGEVLIRERQALEKSEETGYAETSDWKKWPAGQRVAQQEFNTDEAEDTHCVLEFPLQAGAYRAILKTQDTYGNPVESRRYILVLDPSAGRFSSMIPSHFAVRNRRVDVGETFEAVWGTGYERGPVLVEMFRDNKRLKQYWVSPDQTQQMIQMPVEETLRGGFTVLTTFVKENREYRYQTRVDVPWSNKHLDLQWRTFRSKLEPGQKETWSIHIKGPQAELRAAEMAATLYDESLDQFYPHHFPSLSGIFKRDRTGMRQTFSNGARNLSTFLDVLNTIVDYTSDTYIHFPAAITENLFGYAFANKVRRGMVMDAAQPMAAEMEGMPPPAPRSGGKKKNGDDDLGEDAAVPTPTVDLTQVQARKNLDETAFFYPQLITGEDGTVTITFQMPEALTRWRFLGFAHTGNLESGSLEAHAVTRKELMVQPNPPRFLREGDILEFTVKVTNMGESDANGRVKLTFFNPQTEQSLDAVLGNTYSEQPFFIPAQQSRSISWKITVPDGLDILAYKAVGATEQFSDGEEGLLPVLSRRIFVQEALPLWISSEGRKQFRFEKLLDSAGSTTLQNKGLTVQMTSNPAWYAVLALPYLMEYPYECSEQIFNRLYANALARHIARSNPKIRRIFDAWKGTDVQKSNLEKNEELKSVLLQESPWVLQARNETEARHRIGLLFDANNMAVELNRAVLKLRDMQLSDGSWPWFPGGRSNSYITLYLVTGFGRLRHLGIKDIPQDMAVKALDHLDGWIQKMYEDILKRDQKDQNNLNSTIALYLYGRSFYLKDKPVPRHSREAVDYFMEQADQYWLKVGIRQSQAHLALALHRFGHEETPRKIMQSIKERSVVDEEMGRFWRELELSWWWYRAPIETQALMIEAFAEVAGDAAAMEECKIWLLKQKQTQDWKTTKATADAVYGLLLRGANLLASDEIVEVRLGGKMVKPEKVDAGTGYYEKRFGPGEILPAMGNITVEKKDEGIAWGGVHWQYMEDISKITPHTQNPLTLKKTVFVRKYTHKGPVIQPVTGSLKVGDLVTIRIELRTDRDMEYVHMKDHRGSGLEPVNVLSRYRYQDGLAYYESTKDTATHFFIDYLPKGTYVFEYALRVVHRGEYQNGMAHIECMYAPEFNSHSQSVELDVR